MDPRAPSTDEMGAGWTPEPTGCGDQNSAFPTEHATPILMSSSQNLLDTKGNQGVRCAGDSNVGSAEWQMSFCLSVALNQCF